MFTGQATYQMGNYGENWMRNRFLGFISSEFTRKTDPDF